MIKGTLHTIGMGPGDPDLLTVKAARLLGAAQVIAYFAKSGRTGHARAIASPYLRQNTEELRFEFPYTTELGHDDQRYVDALSGFYDASAARIAERLDQGVDVALLCEGDPFFYGSSMYLFDRLGKRYATAVIPGITGMSGCWTRAGTPITHGDDVLTVLPGTLSEDDLTQRLAAADAAVVMKLGRNLPKVRAALQRAGLHHRAVYVERGTMAGETIQSLEHKEGEAPYFSMILVPGRQGQR